MEPTTTKCRELICCCACLKGIYDRSALDLCLSVPQIPLLTAVLMLLIYKVLTSINKPLWCCWDILLSPFSIRGCWESLVISWDHCGFWTKLGMECGAVNSQPGRSSSPGALWQRWVQHCHLSHCQNASQVSILTQKLLMSSAGSGCSAEYSLSAGVSSGLLREGISEWIVSVLALSLAGCCRQSWCVKTPLIWV